LENLLLSKEKSLFSFFKTVYTFLKNGLAKQVIVMEVPRKSEESFSFESEEAENFSF
jgi:hypothetical protein